MPVDGGVGLRIRLATDPDKLVADIRIIAEVLDRERIADLEFADRMRPLQDTDTVARLDDDLEMMLSSNVDEVGHRLSSVVPMGLADAIDDVRAFKVRLNGGSRRETEVTAENLLNRAHILRPGTRLQTFREGRISAYADDGCNHLLGGTKAIEWLEAVTIIDDRHFALVDGHWYEINVDYQERLRRRSANCSRSGPTWVCPTGGPVSPNASTTKTLHSIPTSTWSVWIARESRTSSTHAGDSRHATCSDRTTS